LEARTTATRMPAPLWDPAGGATLEGTERAREIARSGRRLWCDGYLEGRHSLSLEELTIEDLDHMGPIDYVVIEFPDGKHKGEAAPLLLDLVDRGIVRILDLMFITKEQDGSVSGVEISDLDGDGVGEFRVFEGASAGLLTEEDRNEAGNAMEPGSAALVVLFENRWAAPFGRAMRKAGGQLVAFGRIPTQTLMAALDAAEAQS
jgi:Family of unknown function (DUF6325)